MQELSQIFISNDEQKMSLKLKTNLEILKNLYFDYRYTLYNNN